MANTARVAAAPERMSGDGIDLTPLLGKMVGVLCRVRDQKETKFGKRSMTHVLMVQEGHKAGEEALEGIMFQTYFQDLKLGQWYVGIVAQQEAGRNKAWVLKTDKLAKGKLEPFVKMLGSIELHDTGETLLG